ncbi:MAG: hypothetical protein IID17_06305 [Nitrospinae bacterium]|nr:hypothetical protein [Nitrospinota bacterium]
MNPKADMGIEAMADKYEAAELARELAAYEQSMEVCSTHTRKSSNEPLKPSDLVPGPSNDDLPF